MCMCVCGGGGGGAVAIGTCIGKVHVPNYSNIISVLGILRKPLYTVCYFDLQGHPAPILSPAHTITPPPH